jgi:exopolyphosphatase/guanosine-5'-triphosphate,3'-diphosphate pyrophosphatase
VAAIDVGSNTIHLVVAQFRDDEHDLEILTDVTELVRLGADVAAGGAIGPARMAHALTVIAEQRMHAETLGATTILGIATEGVRAATNGAQLLARAQTETALTLRLINGDQEAALTYWGTTSGARDARDPRAVVDLGGGSMELVVGAGTLLRWRTSLPIGSGTLLDACVTTDPPSASDLKRVRHMAAEALRPIIPPLPVQAVIACGGAAATLVGLGARALAPEATVATSAPSANLPGSIGTLSRDTLEALLRLLSSLPAAEVSARFGVPIARAPLLAPGALALLVAQERLRSTELIVSRRGIREGAILAFLLRGEDWLHAATQGSL